MLLAAMAVMVLALASASIPFGAVAPDSAFGDLILQRLGYRMPDFQKDPYLSLLPIDDIDGRSDPVDEAQSLWEGDLDDPIYGSEFISGAQARDEEHLEHSALQGLHKVSGGTVAGEPPQKQVKTDKPLPAYCNPPNPCPVGKTVADNCVENFENSMENNKRLLEQQDCPCDTEHMWSCPAGQQTVTSKGSGGQAALSKAMSNAVGELAMNELAKLQSALTDDNPYLTSGVKREKVVAKKSPGMIRRKRTGESFGPEYLNPYFEGRQLDISIAAKKSPEVVRPKPAV